MIYDAKKIIPGLIIFFTLVSFPAWHSAISGKVNYKPELEIGTNAKQCVEPEQYMIEDHMKLLNEWRNSVVRDDNRTYIASDGREWDISLTDTCMSCHSNEAEFCGSCHDYTGVTIECWNCHVEPEGGD